MKIIDRTPFYNQQGGISLADRTRAVLKYGRGWLSEMEAQKSILPVLESHLDRKFTLLRNAILPGLGVSIPLLLVGPAGLHVLNVTDLAGIYRAKGDQWGTISGATLKPEKINLLIRTEQMALAVQRFLKEQGRLDIPGVESALVFTNPSIHVDSVRPIVRVVLCDALERYIISLSEAAPVISQDMALKVINLITNPSGVSPSTENSTVSFAQPSPEIPTAPTLPLQTVNSSPSDDTLSTPVEDTDLPTILARDISQPAKLDAASVNAPMDTPPSTPETPIGPMPVPEEAQPSFDHLNQSPPGTPGFDSPWQLFPGDVGDLESPPGMIPLQTELPSEPYSSPLPASLFPGFSRAATPPPILQESMPARKKPVSGRQWLILGGLALIWLILAGILLFFILKDLL